MNLCILTLCVYININHINYYVDEIANHWEQKNPMIFFARLLEPENEPVLGSPLLQDCVPRKLS